MKRSDQVFIRPAIPPCVGPVSSTSLSTVNSVWSIGITLILLSMGTSGEAQIVPTKRQLFQMGYIQPGGWHSGLGGGLGYRSKKNSWQVILSSGYGVDAIRNGQRGKHSVGLLLQYDLESQQRQRQLFDAGTEPDKSRFINRLFRGLNIFR